MSRQDAIRKIAEGLYELADALFAEDAGSQVTAPVVAPTSGIPGHAPTGVVSQPTFEAFAEAAAEIFPEQGSLSVCPKHHVPFEDGQYGPYCKQITDDPAWGKQKGDRLWCRITPKNAAEWLRITAAA